MNGNLFFIERNTFIIFYHMLCAQSIEILLDSLCRYRSTKGLAHCDQKSEWEIGFKYFNFKIQFQCKVQCVQVYDNFDTV